MVGPILTQFGYHVIKVEDFRTTEGKEEVKTRHILMKIKIGPETSNEINSNANLFAYDANELGFDAAAESFNVEIKTADKISEDTKYIGTLGFLPSAVKFAFSDKPIGEVSKLFQTENAFVIFKLDNINAEHFKPLEDVKETIKNSLVKEKREQKLKEIANSVYAEIKAGKTLQDVVAMDPNYAYSKVDTVAISASIGTLGRSNKIIGAVMALQENEISTPLELQNKFGFVKLVSKTDFNEEAYNEAKDAIGKTLLDGKKQTFYSQWMQAVRDEAVIIDNRANIF